MGNQNRIAFTPPADCDVFVLCAASGIWGWGGGTVTMSVDCPQLEAVSQHVGKISGGNTEYHQLVFWSVFRGAKAGVTYSFVLKQSDDVGVMGDAKRTALCMAVHL